MFLVHSRWPQSLHVFLSHFILKLNWSWFCQSLLFTLLFLASTFRGNDIAGWHHLEINRPFSGVCLCWSRSPGMIIVPRWCSPSSQIPVFLYCPRFYGLYCFLLWYFSVTTRESHLGQLAFSLFQLIYEPILWDWKDFSAFFQSWERCSGAAQILCNLDTSTAASIIL